MIVVTQGAIRGETIMRQGKKARKGLRTPSLIVRRIRALCSAPRLAADHAADVAAIECAAFRTIEVASK